MKKIILLIAFAFAINNINAQTGFADKFHEANTLMEENQENVALPIWLKLLEKDPYNCNINYKIGVCYIKSTTEKSKSESYLLMATHNIAKKYDPFSASEFKAPIESIYYLAKAYHLDYRLDLAIEKYQEFKNNIDSNHDLYIVTAHNIEQCNYAKIAIKTPVNVEIINLGDQINSKYDDYSPVISLDETSLYFTSKRIRIDSSNQNKIDPDNGKYFEDIYVSHNYDGVWSKAKLVGISTPDHEATLNIAVDGNSLFAYKGEDIYIASLDKDGEWSELTKMGMNINTDFMESHAHVSPNENTLYFVSEKEGGLGGKDIYISKKLPNGEWGKPQNIGPAINTEYNEDGVFIHPDGKTIYFSSEGHSSIGGFDIFSSSIDDDGNWSKPQNLGYPINSTDHDVFFVTSADGKRGYYSSFHKGGFGGQDIYKISLKDANVKPVTLLNGIIRVIGSKEIPENSLVTVTNNQTGELVGEYRPRQRDGKFCIILNPGFDYHIVYTAAEFKQEEDLYIPEISAYQEINRGIDLEYVILGDESGEIIENTESISAYKEYFDYNRKEITTTNSKYIETINKAVNSFKTSGVIKISIESSASYVPTNAFKSNTILANTRAIIAQEKTINALISKGIKKEDIIIMNINSKVRGPKYNNNSSDKSLYQKFQYVTIRVH